MTTYANFMLLQSTVCHPVGESLKIKFHLPVTCEGGSQAAACSRIFSCSTPIIHICDLSDIAGVDKKYVCSSKV